MCIYIYIYIHINIYTHIHTYIYWIHKKNLCFSVTSFRKTWMTFLANLIYTGCIHMLYIVYICIHIHICTMDIYVYVCVYVHICVSLYICLVAKLWPTLCNPMDCNPPGSSVYGILQARVLEWVAIFFSRGSSWPRN